MLSCIATSEAARATSEASRAATKTTPAAAAAEPYRSSCRLHTLAAKLERALPNWEAATLVLRVHALLAPRNEAVLLADITHATGRWLTWREALAQGLWFHFTS